MNSVGKIVVKMGLLSLLPVMPLAAQIDNSAGFTTSFPFYADDTKLPAGHYNVTESDANADYFWSRVSTVRTRYSSTSYLRNLHNPIASLMSPSKNTEIRTI